VDLVDEQDVLQLEAGKDRGHVALPLERRAGDGADADAERLATRLGCGERDSKLLLDTLLADELVEAARAERALELLLLGAEDLGRDSAHQAACLSASLTRSSAGSSGSTAARACSASRTE
jgi:hypothetical protein